MTKYLSLVLVCLVFIAGCAKKSITVGEHHADLGESKSALGSTLTFIVPCSEAEASANDGKCKYKEGREMVIIPSSSVVSQTVAPAVGPAIMGTAGYLGAREIRKGLENQPADAVNQSNTAVQSNSNSQPRRHHR